MAYVILKILCHDVPSTEYVLHASCLFKATFAFFDFAFVSSYKLVLEMILTRHCTSKQMITISDDFFLRSWICPNTEVAFFGNLYLYFRRFVSESDRSRNPYGRLWNVFWMYFVTTGAINNISETKNNSLGVKSANNCPKWLWRA